MTIARLATWTYVRTYEPTRRRKAISAPAGERAFLDRALDLERGGLAAGEPVGLDRGVGVAQVTLGVERAHAAGARRGDRLAVGVVDDVADREDALEVGPGRARDDLDVAVLVDRD